MKHNAFMEDQDKKLDERIAKMENENVVLREGLQRVAGASLTGGPILRCSPLTRSLMGSDYSSPRGMAAGDPNCSGGTPETYYSCNTANTSFDKEDFFNEDN